MLNLEAILTKQRKFFKSSQTKSIAFRLEQLVKLKELLKKHENDILESLKKDLNKSSQEAYMTELGLVYAELDYHLKHLKRNTKPKRVKTPLMLFKAKSYYIREPYGQVLIVGPFNYPLQLLFIPLIGAIASGNTTILKPSEQTLHCSKLMRTLLNEAFDVEFIYVIDSKLSQEELNSVLDYRYDLIFFTGSTRIGKIVLSKAAEHLTPVVLELGGKSPCIVAEEADLKMSAKRIIWGKLINAGQTCIAPDYLLVSSKVKDELIKELLHELRKQYQPETFACIINEKTIERLQGYLNEGEIIYGGKYNKEQLFFEPTLIEVNRHSSIMKDEIFGPILPILTYDNLDSALEELTTLEKPLVLYYFDENKDKIKKVINNTFCGDIVVNDTLIHSSNNFLPFGGVGYSGMGSYHGINSYDAFSYKKSVVIRSTKVEFSFRYTPNSQRNNSIIRKILK